MGSPTRDVLLSRFLTRSGDQAWDFALPITLVSLFPAHTPWVIALFFASKAASVVFFPRLARVVDDWRRLKTAALGTLLQAGGVLVVSLCLLIVAVGFLPGTAEGSLPLWLMGFLSLCLVVGSVASSLGQSLMDVAVGHDWLPGLVPQEKLAHVNSRLRQVDLTTEVGAPLVAGIVLLWKPPAFAIAGFFCVAMWNLVSFAPELLLLRRAVMSSHVLHRKNDIPTGKKQSLWQSCVAGWSDFFAQPILVVMLASALLWLSVLSPHGILLTTYLKADWELSESVLGLFRGGGAAVGLLATVVYPMVRKNRGLVSASGVFLKFQAVAVLAAGLFFAAEHFGAFDSQNHMTWRVVGFLACVVVSRLGLYGFLLGETEIRQVAVPEQVRGRVNGVATALTSAATLMLFGLGSVLSSSESFVWLVGLSVAAVLGAAFLFGVWQRNH